MVDIIWVDREKFVDTSKYILSQKEINDLLDIIEDFYDEEDKFKIITFFSDNYKDDKFVINLLSNKALFFELLKRVLFKLNYFWWSKERKEHVNILKSLNKEKLQKLKEQLFWEYKYNIETLEKNIEESKNRLKDQEQYKQQLLFVLDWVELTAEEKKVSPHKEIEEEIKNELSKIDFDELVESFVK